MSACPIPVFFWKMCRFPCFLDSNSSNNKHMVFAMKKYRKSKFFDPAISLPYPWRIEVKKIKFYIRIHFRRIYVPRRIPLVPAPATYQILPHCPLWNIYASLLRTHLSLKDTYAQAHQYKHKHWLNIAGSSSRILTL